MDYKNTSQENQNSTSPEAEEVSQNSTPPNLYSSEPPKKSSKKKLFIILLVLLVVVGGSAAAWYLKDSKKQDNPADTPNTAQTSEDNQAQTKELQPNTVVYAFREKDNQPFSLFWRPAAGGDRTEAQKLTSGEYVNYSTVQGNQVAVVTSGGSTSTAIWYSSDGGKKYQKIFSEPKATGGYIGPQITSLIFSTDAKSIVFGYLPDEKLNTIKEIKLDNSNKTTNLFTSSARGVFLEGYNSSAKKVLFFEGCYNCDGNSNRELLMRDLSKNSTTSLLKSTKGAYEVEVKSDFSELLVVQGTDDSDTAPGIPSYFVAPYEIFKLNLADLKQTPVANVAKGSETEYSPFDSKYFADESNTYYFYGKQLFGLKSPTPNLLFESSRQILASHYVSDKAIITTTGEYVDFTLNYFNLSDKTNKTILSGDGNTTIFGVTQN